MSQPSQFRVPHGVRETDIPHDHVVELADVRLQYADVGSGEPVLMIHGTSTIDAVVVPLSLYEPLFDEYRIVSYYRAGYAGSEYFGNGMSVERGAEHAVELLDHLGIERAHLVAYSAGGVYAFEALMNYPDRFVTASLLEPWLPREVPATVEAINAIIARSDILLEQGRIHEATREWIGSTTGHGFFSCLEVYGPTDVWSRIERDIVPTFQVDLPAIAAWGFLPSQAAEHEHRKPKLPVLNVLGHDSEGILPGFHETFRFLQAWLPDVERAGVPHATHGLQVMNPLAVGELIYDFVRRHPA